MQENNQGGALKLFTINRRSYKKEGNTAADLKSGEIGSAATYEEALGRARAALMNEPKRRVVFIQYWKQDEGGELWLYAEYPINAYTKEQKAIEKSIKKYKDDPNADIWAELDNLNIVVEQTERRQRRRKARQMKRAAIRAGKGEEGE